MSPTVVKRALPLIRTFCLPMFYANKLKWLESFLTTRTKHVILNNCSSHETNVLSGVPQGTVLTHLLLLLYINDLPQCVHNEINLYADDFLLYSVIHSEAVA